MNVDSNAEARTERKEKEYTMVLLQHKFIVGEIEEEADLFLTGIATVMSIVAVLVGIYFCIYGVLIPYYESLKRRVEKKLAA